MDDTGMGTELLDDDLSVGDRNPLLDAMTLEDATEDSQEGSNKFLYIASTMAAIGGITFGYDMGIISGAMLQLTDDLDLSSHQQEVVVSAMLIGALIGSLVGGFFLDWFGRRLTVIVNTLVFIVGALVMALAGSYQTLVLGRLVVGVAMAISGIGECIYVSEISPPDKRGSLVLLNETGICLGILLAYLVNFMFISTNGGWRFMFLLSAVPALVQAVGMFVLPASPRYLLMRGKDMDAHTTLCRLRGTSQVRDEWVQLKSGLRLELKRNHRFCDLCSSRRNMRVRMLIAVGLVIFENLTGQTTVIYYAPTIFQMLGFSSDFTATLATVGLGFTKLIASIIALFSVDVAGRRQLLLLGSGLMMVVIAILGVSARALPPPADNAAVPRTPVMDNTDHHLQRTTTNNHLYTSVHGVSIRSQHRTEEDSRPVNGEKFINETNSYVRRTTTVQEAHIGTAKMIARVSNNTSEFQGISYNSYISGAAKRSARSSDSHSAAQETPYYVKVVAVVSLMLYVFAFSLGFGPVVWLLLSEMFPADIRGRAASIAQSMNFITNILINMTFLDIVDSVGVSSTFLIFAVVCLLSVLYIYVYIPETKGCSLEEISQTLSQRKFCNCFSGKLVSCCLGGDNSDSHIP